MVFLALASGAIAQPRPPCAGEPVPAYPRLDEAPVVQVWTGSDLVWKPPTCVGWDAGAYTLLVAAAGRFSYSGDAAGLLGRFARISEFGAIRYWSVTTGQWRRLILDAYALSEPDRALRRDDFTVDELTPGRTFYFWQEERSPAGALIYRSRIVERTEGRVVVDIRNENAVHPFPYPVIPSGAYRFLYVLEQESSGIWRYYGLSGQRGSGSATIGLFRASYINRAVAIYRYIAGIPTDREPPAAP